MTYTIQGSPRGDICNNRIPTPEPQASSPIRPLGSQSSDKPKRRPTVTPRTFTRFFTPRSSLERGRKVGASRQILRDITLSGSNRKHVSKRGKQLDNQIQTIEHDHGEGFADISKKRKRYQPISPDTTPDLSSPVKRMRNQTLEILEDEIIDDNGWDTEHDISDSSLEEQALDARLIGNSIIRRSFGPSRMLFSREMGETFRTRRPRYPLNDWQCETSGFFSGPHDSHLCDPIEETEEQAMPFCITSCNKNSLVAIGDEKGGVRLLESAEHCKSKFSKAYLSFRPHRNAILDLAFSANDILLATASGDQTGQVIDMPTQRSTYTMTGHTASLKEVRFQPGNTSVIATSSRDGSVRIWDLRCTGYEPVQDLKVSLDPADKPTHSRNSSGQRMTWARSVNTIANAHASHQCSQPISSLNNKLMSCGENTQKPEPPGRRSDVSVTCLSFLQPGREHLLLTGSAADASVKLWDLRTTHSHRRSRATPLSCTRQPESHINHRRYGLNSIALSGDEGRLYTLCRDNTVYTYSTSHLILGHAPDLTAFPPGPRRYGGKKKEGLGPIYGFRHPQFRATTFFVKCALRPATGDRSEMLAVASSDACIIVFPTDEQYVQSSNLAQKTPSFSEDPVFRSIRPRGLQGPGNSTSITPRLSDTVNIYQHGSPLVRGHSREVTGVTWTPTGDLVSVGDDFTARCWREDGRGEAREMRVCGEGQGRRWGCGWAEVKEGWDDDGS